MPSRILRVWNPDETAWEEVGDSRLTVHAAAVDPHPGYVLESTVDAKGDLLAASAADTVGRLALGTNGQVLTADSTQSLGVKWATPAAGGGLATDPLADAKGDVFAASGNDAIGRLPLGTDGHVLTADSTQSLGVKWAAGGGAAGDFVEVAGDTMTGVLILQGASGTTNVLQVKLAADANPRFRSDASGKLEWVNPGTGAVYSTLVGNAASTLEVTSHFQPSATSAYRLGSTSRFWDNLYVNAILMPGTGTLTIGTSNVAGTGAVRLQNGQVVAWRNAGNSANLTLAMDSSDRLALGVGTGSLTTSATGGSATALPAQPTGYLTVVVNGSAVKLPYYS